MEVGGWVQASLKNKIGKSFQNSPILAQIFGGSIPCVFCVFRFVSHYDSSILSWSVHRYLGVVYHVYFVCLGLLVIMIRVFCPGQ